MKLLCKKSLTNYTFLGGKYYKFYEERPYGYKHYYLFEKKNYIWFTTDKNSIWYIWDYFYTPQEERKMKLKQIYETTL